MLRLISWSLVCSAAIGQAPAPPPPAWALFANGIQVGTERWSEGGAGTSMVVREQTVTTWEPWTWLRHDEQVGISGEVTHGNGVLVGLRTKTRIGSTTIDATLRVGDGVATWSVGEHIATASFPTGAALVPDGCIGLLCNMLRGEPPRTVALVQPSSPLVALGTVEAGPPAHVAGHESIALRCLRAQFDGFRFDVWFDGETPLVARDSRTGLEARATNAAVAPHDLQVTNAPPTILEEGCTFASGDLRLFGVLTRPRTTKPLGMALLLSGSGPDAEDAPIAGHPFLATIAWHLTAAGFVTLRCADRGVGRSGGTFPGIRVADLVADARAGLACLRQRNQDLPALIVGHSEGALIAATVADGAAVRGVVLLGCPAKSVTRTIVEQTYAQFDELGSLANEEAERLETFFARAAATRGATMTSEAGNTLAIGWIQDHAALEPKDLVAALRCRVAILHGSADRQVPVADADVLAAALRTAGRGTHHVQCLPDLDHAFARAHGPAGDGPDPAFLHALRDCALALLR